MTASFIWMASIRSIQRPLKGQNMLEKNWRIRRRNLKKELESYGPKGPSWDFVTFYEELCRRFLKGRIEEPYGTNLLASSESLTFLSWNYGNMVRGQKYTTPRFLQGLDSAMRPRKQSAMSLQNEQFENNLFFNMLFFLRAHVVILQEAHLLVPVKDFY